LNSDYNPAPPSGQNPTGQVATVAMASRQNKWAAWVDGGNFDLGANRIAAASRLRGTCPDWTLAARPRGMIPDLERLIQLQRAETELRRAQSELTRIPEQKAEHDARLAAERARLEAVREKLAGSQKGRRDQEGRVQDFETKRSRYKTQLMEVKTNKEYTAMLHEIETVEREIRGLEDLILGEMERAETFAAEVKAEERELKSVEERHRNDLKVLDERAKVLEVEVAKLKGERDRVAATLDEELLARFERVAKRRGSGVAEARDGTCQECHVKLRLQMYSELKRNDAITECPACNRILYYEPPVPVSAPQP
jgi:predicted  nucleic acid-binding Zn-ribbon protein